LGEARIVLHGAIGVDGLPVVPGCRFDGVRIVFRLHGEADRWLRAGAGAKPAIIASGPDPDPGSATGRNGRESPRCSPASTAHPAQRPSIRRGSGFPPARSILRRPITGWKRIGAREARKGPSAEAVESPALPRRGFPAPPPGARPPHRPPGISPRIARTGQSLRAERPVLWIFPCSGSRLRGAEPR